MSSDFLGQPELNQSEAKPPAENTQSPEPEAGPQPPSEIEARPPVPPSWPLPGSEAGLPGSEAGSPAQQHSWAPEPAAAQPAPPSWPLPGPAVGPPPGSADGPPPQQPSGPDPVAGPPASTSGSDPEPAPNRRGRNRRAIIEWGAILAVAVLAAVILRAFIVQPYFIPSGSMEPTLKVGDKVLVNKLSYDFHSVHRGDIIVFKKPPNDYSPGITDLIKRVIGLPGETIWAQGGSVYVDGSPLREPWLPRGTTTSPFPPTHIPGGEYFVMGDNRGNSADSRVIGPIAKKLIIGRAFLLVWPVSRFGTL